MKTDSRTKLQPKYIAALFAVGVLLAALFSYFALFKPQWERAAGLSARLETEKAQVRVIQEYALAHPDGENHLRQVRKNLARVDAMLPSVLQVNEFILQIEQAAKTGGVELIQVSPGQVADKNGYREIPVDILVRGNYFSTLRFVKNLEDGPRFNIITDFSSQSQDGVLTSKLTVSIFSFGASDKAVASWQMNPGPGKK